LPLTPETEGIFCARTFAMMPSGAMLVNVGRGKHVVDKDLIAALDSGQLSYAALDALWPEPLPPESPLWLHPKVTVMPHVARRPTVAQLVTEVAANIRSLKAGGRLLQEVTSAGVLTLPAAAPQNWWSAVASPLNRLRSQWLTPCTILVWP
jgi:glyoxylate/hydroxypyruvate reductase A